MAWKQIRSANADITYTGGWCLSAVQDSFGTDHPYPTATAAWNGVGEKRVGEPPLGIDVPIYFSFTTEPAGHVAVRFADGRVGSSTQSGKHRPLYMHPNIQDLLNVYRGAGWNIQYLGWKDVVGTQQVVKQEDEEVRIANTPEWRGRMNKLHHQLVGNWDMSDAVWGSIIGGEVWFVVESWSDHPNAEQLIKDQELGEKARTEDWASRPKEVVVEKQVVKEIPVPYEVEKIVEKEVIVEIAKGDDERSLGDLLSAAFKKLFKIK